MSRKRDENPRAAALEVLTLLFHKSVPIHRSLAKFSNSIKDVRDQRLFRKIVFEVARWYGVFSLAFFSYLKGRRKGWKALPLKTRMLLCMAYAEYCGFNRVPEYAIFSQTLQLADRRSNSRPLIHAVLSKMVSSQARLSLNSARLPFPYLQASVPQWLRLRWVQELGEEMADARMRWLLRKPPTVFRASANELNKIKEAWKGPGKLRPGRHFEDCVYLVGPSVREEHEGRDVFAKAVRMIEPSCCAVKMLNPKKDEKILDLCCGSGGKSRLIQETMNGQGFVFSLDFSSHQLKEMVKRWGRSLTRVQASAGSLPFPSESFDAVLLDPPCSGMGVASRRPDIKWRRKAGDFERFQKQQKFFLKTAWGTVKAGGRLVYGVCSTEKEETTEVVEEFERGFPDAKEKEEKIFLTPQETDGFYLKCWTKE